MIAAANKRLTSFTTFREKAVLHVFKKDPGAFHVREAGQSCALFMHEITNHSLLLACCSEQFLELHADSAGKNNNFRLFFFF